MEWLRKVLGHGDIATKDVVDDLDSGEEFVLEKFEPKDASEYPETFESLVSDYNELQKTYEAQMRLIEAQEFALLKTNEANDLLLRMNVDLVATLRLRADAEFAQREQDVDYGTDPNG